MEKEEEDANLLERCEEKRRNGQNIGNVKRKQNMQNTPWTNEELKEYEGALPRLKKGDLEKVSRLYKAKTGVGCDGFHPKVLLDLTKENKTRNRGVLREGGAEWKMVTTSLHDDVLLDSEECYK